MVLIRLLGAIEIWAGQPLRLGLGRKLKEFLGFLAIRQGTAQRREKIAEALWPERAEGSARSALNTGLWRLKSQLDGQGLGDRVRLRKTDDGAIALLLGPEVEVDCLTLQTAVQSAATRLRDAGTLPDDERAMLQAALDRYDGPFLEGYDSEWLLPERERFHSLQIRGLSVLMHAWARRGRYDEAIDCALRIVAQDPMREKVQRELMWLHLMNGQRCEAIAQYRRLTELLRDELDVEPMAETTALYEHILSENRAYFEDARHAAGASHLSGVLAFIDGCARRRADVFDALAQADPEPR